MEWQSLGRMLIGVGALLFLLGVILVGLGKFLHIVMIF
jgi:hypothetical protein